MEQTTGRNKWSQCCLPEGFVPRQKFHSLAVEKKKIKKKKGSYKPAVCQMKQTADPLSVLQIAPKAPLLFVILKLGVGGLTKHADKILFTSFKMPLFNSMGWLCC